MGKNGMWLCGLFIILAADGLGSSAAAKAEKPKPKLSWSQRAAAEAEAVAAISCSGHGEAYLDGITEDGNINKPVCECNLCYGGPDCSHFNPDCPADADSGDPVFMAPFWRKHAESSAVVISGWHRLSYTFPDNSYISRQLEKYIHKLHARANNAVTRGRYILYGAGSTQLLSAAVFALSINNTSQSRVVAVPPFYPVYRSQTIYFDTDRFEFDDTLSTKNQSLHGTKVIEFVASPSNPEGKLTKSAFKGRSVKTIHDHAYYWPHYTAIPAPSDEHLMIFTMSKYSGHAGSRFGWALVKDKAIYDNMVAYMEEQSVGTSRDTQLRALQIFKTILRGNGSEIYDFAYKIMRQRWKKVSSIISMSKRFTLQNIPPQFCTYFGRVRGPSPAYAWVRCERKEDTNCTEVFRAAKIVGRPGRLFIPDDRYVRLSLIKSQDDFDLLLPRLTALVSE